MAGRVVNIIPKTSYKFNISTSQTASQAIGPRAIATPDWVSGALIVRVHDASFSGTAPTAVLGIGVNNVSISPDDPNTLFIELNSEGDGPSLAGIEINDSTPTGAAEGSLRTARLGSDTVAIGSMVAVFLHLKQGTVAGEVAATISVDLVGRDQ